LWRVEFDEVRITVTHPQGEQGSAEWAGLTKIAIRTTDDGPWDMDVFWGFHENGSNAASTVFPGGATGERALMEELSKRLPGASYDQIIKAMGSTSNAYFVVWDSGKTTEMGT
jgi:hypothetical protein